MLPREHAPGGDFGRAVPAHVHDRLFAGVVQVGRDRRRARRAPAPGEAKAPVGDLFVGEVGVEQQRAVGGVLADLGHAAVLDDRVPVRERLHVALAGGEQRRVGVGVGLRQRRRVRLQVQPDPQGARLVVDRRVGAVVEQGDFPVREHAAVVLPRGLRARPHLERALQAAEAPEDLAAAAFQLVGRPTCSAPRSGCSRRARGRSS